MKCYLYRLADCVCACDAKPNFMPDGSVQYDTEPLFVIRLPLGSPFVPDKCVNMQFGDIMHGEVKLIVKTV